MGVYSIKTAVRKITHGCLIQYSIRAALRQITHGFPGVIVDQRRRESQADITTDRDLTPQEDWRQLVGPRRGERGKEERKESGRRRARTRRERIGSAARDLIRWKRMLQHKVWNIVNIILAVRVVPKGCPELTVQYSKASLSQGLLMGLFQSGHGMFIIDSHKS